MSGQACLPEAGAHLTYEEAKTEEVESLGPVFTSLHDFTGMASSYLISFYYSLSPEGSAPF